MHNNFSPESDSTDNKAKHAISFAEKKLLRMIKEEGIFHDNVWKLSHEIALLSLNLGMSFIRKKNFLNGETFILKAKKVTEPPNPGVNWEARLDWQIIRFNIFQNLAIIYQNQKKDEKAYELLKSLVKHLKPENIMTQNAEIMISSIDNLYVNLANLCYTLNHHDECMLYSNLGVKFMNLVLNNADLLNKIEFLLKRNNEDLTTFVASQKMLIAYLFHLIGKCELKKENISSALSNYSQAYVIARDIKGEKDEITVKYRKKFNNLRFMQENQRKHSDFGDGMSDSLNHSENHSPAGKKMRFIKNFVKNQDQELIFMPRQGDSPIRSPLRRLVTSPSRRGNEESKPKIPLNNISPNGMKQEEFSKKNGGDFTKRSREFNQIFFKFDDAANATNTMLAKESLEQQSKSRQNFPINNLFLAASDLRPPDKPNYHIKSLTSNSDELNSFLLHKPIKNKKEMFHRSKLSQQFPYFNNYLNTEQTATTSQRSLLYNIGNLSTRPSSRPTTLSNPIDFASQKMFTLPDSEPLNPPKKYQFLILKRPTAITKPSEPPKIEQPIVESPLHHDENPLRPPPPRERTIIHMIGNVPSITINSIGEFFETNNTLSKNNSNNNQANNQAIRTPKSSFSSINTPKVKNPTPSKNDPSKPPKENPLCKSVSIKKNISVKIPSKQNTINMIRLTGSTHNTPSLTEAQRKPKQGLASSQSAMTMSINSRKFSVQTPNIPAHGLKNQKEDKKLPETISRIFPDTESPIKVKNETPSFQRQTTMLHRQPTIFKDEPEPIVHQVIENHLIANAWIAQEKAQERAVLRIQKMFRKLFQNKRSKMQSSVTAAIPQRLSGGSRMGKDSINLRSLKNSEINSLNSSKFSPRKEEAIVSTKLMVNEEVSKELLQESEDSCSLLDQSEGKDLNVLPLRLWLNVLSRYCSWTLVNLEFRGLKGNSRQKKQFEARIALGSSLFNIYFTWNLEMDSNKQKLQRGGAWKLLNHVLESKLRTEKHWEFYLLHKDSLENTGNLSYQQPFESIDANSIELSEILSCVGKLKFFLRHFFLLKRKIVGKIWQFSANLPWNTKISFYNRENHLFLSSKRLAVQSIICKTDLQTEQPPSLRSHLKKMQSLDHLDPFDKSSKNPEEYSLFSKISSPATSETNYIQKNNRVGLPPMKSQQRPSISLSLYDNHIRLIKKAEGHEHDDYRFQTLTQPPVLLTQLKTALSSKEMASSNPNKNNNNSETPSKKGSTVREVSEDIVEISEDSDQQKINPDVYTYNENEVEEEAKESEKQSVMIKKDSISNEYISIENAIKAAGLMLQSESGSPQSPNRRVTYSPRRNKMDRSGMKKCLTGVVGETHFEDMMESIMKSNSHFEKEDSEGSNQPRLRLTNSFKRKQRFVRDEVSRNSAIEEEQSPVKKTIFIKETRQHRFYKFHWDYYRDLKPLPCPRDLFPAKVAAKLLSEKFVNCFEDQEILIQRLIKIQNQYFVFLLSIEIQREKERIIDFIKNVDKEIVDGILKNFMLKIELIQMSSKFNVRYAMKMSFEEFNNNLLDNSFTNPKEILKFFHFKRFNLKSIRILFKNLRKISIENCNLQIKEVIQQKIVEKASLSYSQQIILPESEENLMENETLVLHDPLITKMKYYNSIKILNKDAYYEKFVLDGEIYVFRVRFHKGEDSDTAKISVYQPLSSRIEYQTIKSQIVYEKLITFMQITNKQTKTNLFRKLFLDYPANFIGKKMSISISKREGLNFLNNIMQELDFFHNFTQNIFSKRDHPIMTHYFTVKTFFENFEIENLGRAYVKISMFKLKPLKQSQFLHNFTCFFLLEVFPNATTRFKLQKYVLTANDICTYINFQFSEKNEINLLNELNKNVLSNFIYCKDKLYKSLQLPFNRFSQSNSKKFSLLKMDLNKFGIVKSGIRKFLKPELNEYRIIYQGVRKVFGIFSIVTVKKHHILKFWSIGFYFPKTNRDFSISLYNSDIFRMTSGFFEELFPISMKEIQEIFSNCSTKRITYNLFSQEYEKLMQKNKANIDETKKKSFNIQNEQSPFFSNSKFVMNFVEIKFWEGIISQMNFSKTIQGKIMVNIDNFYTVAIEHLFDQLVVLRNKDLIIFEVMNEHLYHRFRLENSLEPIKYRESKNFMIKLKIHELSSTKISNDTFCLQELLHLYICDSKIKKKKHFDITIDNLKTFSVNHAFLRFLSTFLYLKIRNIEKVITIGCFEKFENDIGAFQKGEDKEEIVPIREKIGQQKLRLNCKLQVQSLYFNNHKKWLLIYKHFLTVRPRQMIAILYSHFHKKICVYLYNNKNCKQFRKYFSVEHMKIHIPYLSEMLELQEFNVIGYRILKCLKNNLLVASFFNLCL